MIKANRDTTRTVKQAILATFLLSMVIVNSYKLIHAWANPTILNRRDFLSYYTAGTLVRDDRWRELYNLELQKQYYNDISKFSHELPFMALPGTLSIFIPLSFFTVQQAYLIYIGIGFIIITIVGKQLRRPYLGLLALAFSPAAFSLAQGQTAIFVLLGMCLAYISLEKNKPFQAGLWYSLCLFKLQFIVGIPFVLLSIKEKKQFVQGLLPLTILGILSATLPYGGLLGFIKMIQTVETSKELINTEIYISSQAYLQNALNITEVTSVLIALIFYTSFLVALYMKKDALLREELYTIAILASLLFGFHVHIHDQILLIIPALLLIEEKKYNLAIMGGFVLLTLFYFKSPLFTAPLLSLAILYILNYKYPNEKNRRDHQKQKQIS